MNIFITGANGFLGSHLCHQAIDNGHKVIAGVRSSANLQNIDSIQNLKIEQLDYSDVFVLTNQLQKILEKYGPVDLFIHNAGLTNASNKDIFFRVNVGITANVIDAVKKSNVLHSKGKFIYTSSLAAIGPVGAGGPVSSYGESKLEAEKLVCGSELSFLIFRPAGIYGPYDMEFLPLFQAVKHRIYPGMTARNHLMKLIHGEDAASNILSIAQKTENAIIPLDDGNIYTHTMLKEALDEVLNRKSLFLNLPPSIVKLYLRLSESILKIFRIVPSMPYEKYNEISQNWDYSFSEERLIIPLNTKYELLEGFKDTYKYYKKHKLI